MKRWMLARWILSCIALGTAALAAHAQSPADKSIEELTVLGEAYRERIIQDFVRSYAKPPRTEQGQLARWRAGICPVTTGLTPDFNKYVTFRLKQVAKEIGAPIAEPSDCKTQGECQFTFSSL